MKTIILIFLMTFMIPSISSIKQDNKVIYNRNMLRDYFLYSCITYGFKDQGILKVDHSGAVYIDLLRYELRALHIIDSIAKDFVDSIPISPYENRNTKGIIILSIEKYKSNEIYKKIIELDKYMID